METGKPAAFAAGAALGAAGACFGLGFYSDANTAFREALEADPDNKPGGPFQPDFKSAGIGVGLTAYALGMLLMAASMPLYHAAEKRWLAQDRLMEITPEAPALSRYEWETAQAMRAELLEVLEAK